MTLGSHVRLNKQNFDSLRPRCSQPTKVVSRFGFGLCLLISGILSACDTGDTTGRSSATSGTGQSSGAATAQSTGAASGGAASTSTSTSGGSAGFSYCTGCNPPVSPGKVGSVINEASGLAASRKHPGRFYVHNDSGDSARFFAIDATGKDHGTYNLTQADAVDWEDMAAGPCGDDHCLYLGDIGDNPENRSVYAVYRVVEPAQLSAGEHSLGAVALPFRYPDGSHNAETLLVHPSTGDIFIVTKKKRGAASLYRFPAQTPDKEVVLEKLGEMAPPKGDNRFTAGDIHPDATGILMRTYTSLFFYTLDKGAKPRAGVLSALGSTPCQVPASLEIQGETVAWILDGSGWLTLSEGTERPIIRVSCF